MCSGWIETDPFSSPPTEKHSAAVPGWQGGRRYKTMNLKETCQLRPCCGPDQHGGCEAGLRLVIIKYLLILQENILSAGFKVVTLLTSRAKVDSGVLGEEPDSSGSHLTAQVLLEEKNKV